MAKCPLYANRKGMTAALDIVEDALASLQARVLQAQQKQQKPELKNAETNTSLRVNTSIRTSSNSVLSEPRQKQKETSVLINRRPNALAISSRQSHKSSQKRVSPRCKTTIPVADQRYAQSTLTSRLRGELSGPPKKEEKENLIPFIPCGSKSTSHHRALIIQQELSHLKNMTSKEQQLVTVPRSCLQEFDADESGSDSERVTEQTVKRALANIQQHITRKANMNITTGNNLQSCAQTDAQVSSTENIQLHKNQSSTRTQR
nr:uncharacterized protein LOC128700301 isoform X3 [Cherax quadricarinatus]